MAEMKTYSDDEMKHLAKPLKNDIHKLLDQEGLMDKEWKEENCTCIICQIGMKWTDDPEKVKEKLKEHFEEKHGRSYDEVV